MEIRAEDGPVPAKAEKEEFSKWEDGCKKARAEITLHVTSEVMHIVRASANPAVKFKTTLGSKGWTTRLALDRQLYYAEKIARSMRA